MNNPQEIFIKVPVSELPEVGIMVFIPDSERNYIKWSRKEKNDDKFREVWKHYGITHFLCPLTAHVFTTEQLQERDREIAGRAWDAALINFGEALFNKIHNRTDINYPDKESYLNTLKDKLEMKNEPAL